MSEYGVVTESGTVRFERVLPGPIERVWAYLTESEKRGKWLATGNMELRVGGRVEHCEPPRLLTLTWGEEPTASEVTFALTPRGSDVLLVLTHRRLGDRAAMVEVAGGWHTHLGILADNLGGVEPRAFWSTHSRLAADYDSRLAPG